MHVRIGQLRGAAAALGVAVLAGACSSSNSNSPATTGSTGGSSGAVSSGGAAATGSPIQIMTISPSGTASVNFPDIPTVLNAYARSVNGKGGIAGHPLKVDYCNDKNDPNAAAACARKAVSDRDIAVVGSFTTFGDSVTPILAAANVPDIATNAVSATEYTSPISYPLVPGPIGFAALGAKAGSECTTTDVVTIDIPATAALAPFIAQGLASAKKTVAKTVKVPPTATDYSSIVSATKGADCVVSALPGALLNVYLAKATSLGVKQKFFAPAGGVGSDSLKQFGAQLEGSYTISSFPVASDPAWADLKSALDAVSQSSVDLVNPENLNAWVAGIVFGKVASKLTTFDASSLKAALDMTSALDTGGLTPPLDFAKPFPLAPLARLFDTSLVGIDIKGGQLSQEGTFTDFGAALRK